jgi:hypothetical protein
MIVRRAMVVLSFLPALAGCRSASPDLEPFGPGKAGGETAVAVWAEPAKLPASGGQVQILVRIRRPNGTPYAGVQVRLRTSEGSLFSDGRTLVTDAQGMVRDRLTSRKEAEIVVLVGDARHRFRVPLTPQS